MLHLSFGRMAVTTSVLALLSGHAALAAVTPEDVWENWKAQATASAYEMISTSVERQGSSLIVDGAEMKQDLAGQKARIVMGRLEFRDLGNGTVQVIVPETYAMTMSGPDMPETNGVMRQVQAEIIASGTPDAMRQDIRIGTFELVFDALPVEGETTTVKMVMGVDGGEGFIQSQGRSIENIDYDLKAGTARMSMSGEGSDAFSFDLTAESVGMLGKMSSLASVAQLANPEDMAKAFADGLAMEGSFTAGPTKFGVRAKDADGLNTVVDMVMAASGAEFAMSQNGMVYGLHGDALDLTVSGDAIPMPQVNATMAEARLRLAIPLAKRDDPQDFSVLTRLVDLNLPDEIWGMVDPMQMVKRLPATVVVDMTGKVKMLTDLLDPATDPEATPGELHALDLKELQVKLLGADLTGAGAFTFDNTDLETFGGMPRPTGALDLQLVGGNALLDTAIAMGLVPEEEAMGYRMMMALFARPGEGEDTLVSKIEVTPDGAVLANGQRIQ